jgi:hypothetical protein
MFKKQQAHSADWATFKVCASTKAPHKANYWFARNYKTGQTAYAKDLVVMKISAWFYSLKWIGTNNKPKPA